MPVTPARLHHLAITVNDVNVSVPFYEEVFGISFRVAVFTPGASASCSPTTPAS